VQSREWELTRALFEEVRREVARSPFANDEAIQRFTHDIVVEICVEREITPSGPLRNALWDAIGEFLASDGLALRLTEDQPPSSLTIEEGVQLRSLLTRQRNFLRDHERLLPMWKRKLVALFVGILGHFPQSAFTNLGEDGEVLDDCLVLQEAKALALCEELPVVLDRSIITFFDDDISNAHLFDRIREVLDRNAHVASDVLLEEQRTNDAKLVLPTGSRNQDPEFLVSAYLTGTPLEKFFNAELPFAIEDREAEEESLVSFASLLERGHLQDEEDWWTGDSSSGFEGLLGFAIDGDRIGAPVACRFATGSAHALLAGVTGSGKNNLLNVLIATLAVRYSPEELEFFMVDLKEGVEFQRFAECGLPHARVISVTNDSEFALNVLRGLDVEMERRGRLFTTSGTKDITAYRHKTGNRLSRILLVIDEAKTIYSGEDAAYVLSFFEKIAAKGRSFGLHMLLANQSFSGASLRFSTIANMGIRLVTKGRGERTSEQVLESSNAILDSLSQHEAVYNDGQGSKDYNHPCRVPEWTDRDDEYLRRLAKKAAQSFRKPLVFNGDDRPLLSSCPALSSASVAQGEEGPRMWLGAPMSLDDTVCVNWKRESKQNLLVVDAAEGEATDVVAAAWAGLLGTVPPRPQQFSLLDLGTPDRVWSQALKSIRLAAGPRVTELRQDSLLEALGRIASIVEARTNPGMYDEPTMFLILHGIHRLRELQNAPPSFGSKRGGTDQKTVTESLGSILRDGPYVGVHVIAWCDTAENVRRFLEPGKLRGEFGVVAAGRQPDDMLSRALVGNGKAATTGANRMVLANSGGDVAPFVFRPYGLPEIQWLEVFVGRQGIHSEYPE
jgi:hypothetical protein